jgi:hypothetical protein
MRAIFIGLATLTLPLGANAVLIGVEYEGTVTSIVGTGFGFAVGDPISGALYIDTALAPPDAIPDANSSSYFNNNANNSGFVTGFSPASTSSIDLVFLSDEAGFDQLVVNDNEFTQIDATTVRQDLLNIRAVTAVDFLAGGDLVQDFELLGAAGMTGLMFSRLAVTISDVTQFIERNDAAFAIRRLRVSPVAVPEPGTALLLAAGLLSMALGRWHARGRR